MKLGKSSSLLKLIVVLGLAFTAASACAETRTITGRNANVKTPAEVVQKGGEQSVPVIVVDRRFHNREIKVKKDGLFVVELEALGAAGYEWVVSEIDESFFEIVQMGTREEPQPGDVTGAPVTRQWRIRAKREGSAVLRLLHRRSWEGPEEASDRFVLKVRILP